ncbi:hypothetical protein WJX81_006375 [Elliptochloris bilobata]|uniref:Protein TIC 20 n=1 Tax=Elliptochloris bilobata TaxID=381761 RepID=A0AAW1S912_9CHLO
MAIASEKVGEFAASGFVFKDSVEIVSVEDPDVLGVRLYISDFKRSLTDKLAKDFFSEPSQASVTCAATGALSVPELSRIRGSEGHEVFSERKGLSLFKNKTLRVRRLLDEKNQTLLYIAYSTRLSSAPDEGISSGRYRTSICALPLISAPTIFAARCRTAAAYAAKAAIPLPGVEARIRDPDAAVDSDELGNRGPPSILVRLASALMYLVPWIDIIGLGRMIYHKFPSSLILYAIPGPLVPIYYSSQFAPLIVFFLLFLAIVKNNKLHHFVRFNCMQGVMLDIVSMLFTLLRTYIPAEIRWSYFMDLYDMFSWNICMCTLLYCVFFALWGKYADVPFISESVYLQVDASM